MKFSLSGNAPFGCISTGTQFREINLLFNIVILSKDFLKKGVTGSRFNPHHNPPESHSLPQSQADNHESRIKMD